MTVWFDFMSCHPPLGTGAVLRRGWRPRRGARRHRVMVYIEKPGPLELLRGEARLRHLLDQSRRWRADPGKKFTGDHFTGAPPDSSHDWVLHVVREGHAGEHEPLVQVRIARHRCCRRSRPIPQKVPFEIEQPPGDLSVSKPAPYAAKITRETRATRSMMWLWTGEVTADAGLSRAGHGPEGNLSAARRPGRETSRAAADSAALRHERQRQSLRRRQGDTGSTSEPADPGVDTTHEYGSLALARGGDYRGGMPFCTRPRASRTCIYGDIAALLERTGALAGIDASPPHPGPARSPACAWGWRASRDWRKRWGNPRWRFRTCRPSPRSETRPLRAAVLDARRGEIYGAVYDDAGRIAGAGSGGERSVAWLETLPPADLEFVTPDLASTRAALSGTAYARAIVIKRRAPWVRLWPGSRRRGSWRAKRRTRRRSTRTMCGARTRNCSGRSKTGQAKTCPARLLGAKT